MDVYIVPVVGSVADWEVRKAEGAPTGSNSDWENGEPLFGPALDIDCIIWCDEHGHSYRHRMYVSTVVPKNFDDLTRRCDNNFGVMRRHADKIGWKFESDCVYRGMPGWYCYTGDLGGRAEFTGVTKETDETDDGRIATGQMHYLMGVSDALWELGFMLVFNSEGRHMVFSRGSKWVTLDEGD